MIGVYVAGASRNKERAREFMRRVRDAGMVITFDWIEAMERVGVGDEELNNPDRRKYSTACLAAVDNAHAVVVLVEREWSTIGAWVELGYALGARSVGQGRRMIIASGGNRRTIFTAPGLVDFECETDEQAFARLVQFAESKP